MKTLVKTVIILLFLFLSGCETGINPDVDRENDVEDIQVYFSPADRVDDILIDLIKNADSEIKAAVYSFNRSSIAEALVAAHRRGVTVKILVDSNQSGLPSQTGTTAYLEQNIPDFRLKTFSLITISMHNKFVVIDKNIVATGSYNWTNNATFNNDENLLVITSKSLAGIYNLEFERLWLDS